VSVTPTLNVNGQVILARPRTRSSRRSSKRPRRCVPVGFSSRLSIGIPGAVAEPVASMAATPVAASGRGSRLAPAIVVMAALGLAIAGYLLAVRLAGGVPACGPNGGCETVQQSEYAELFGIPVAAYGFACSTVVLVAALAWWRGSDRRALLVAYALGILGSLFVAYLTYLEVFVIRALCTWCVAYGTTVVVGFLLAALALRRAGPA
jgi:uncharacterized membrane protein